MRAGGDEGRCESERTLYVLTRCGGTVKPPPLTPPRRPGAPSRERFLNFRSRPKPTAGRAVPRKSPPEIVPSRDRTTPPADDHGPRHGRIPGAQTRTDAMRATARRASPRRGGNARLNAASTRSCSKPGRGAVSRDLHPEHRSHEPSDRPRATPIMGRRPFPGLARTRALTGRSATPCVRREVISPQPP